MNETFQHIDMQVDDPVEHAVLTGIWNSMRIVRQGQLEDSFAQGGVMQKEDDTFVTRWDLRSEAVAAGVFAAMLPGVPFQSEEGTSTTGDSSGIRMGWDPLDGTRSKVVGSPNSTVIGTAYNADGSVYGAAIGEPATGRMLSSFGPKGRVVGRIIADNGTHGEVQRTAPNVRVNKHPLTDRGQVFIDNNLPFRGKDGNTAFTLPQHLALRRSLALDNIGVLEVGSNGAHQLYVASGGDRAAAALTTARGIPEDTSAGLFLVERAGGVVQRYTSLGGVALQRVVKESPEYNLALAANSTETLLHLEKELFMTLERSVG